MSKITESDIELFTIEELEALGYQILHGPDISCDGLFSERQSYSDIILVGRLRTAVQRLNSDIPADVQEQAVQKVLRIYSPDLLHNNETFHQLLIEKVKIPYQQDGYERSYEVALFAFNAVCVISDGMECKAGSGSADFSRYMIWKSADGKTETSRFAPQLETLVKGMLNPTTLLDLVRNFIVFEKSKKEDIKTGITQVETVKKRAAYHQYYAVNKAVENTIKASGKGG